METQDVKKQFSFDSLEIDDSVNSINDNSSLDKSSDNEEIVSILFSAIRVGSTNYIFLKRVLIAIITV